MPCWGDGFNRAVCALEGSTKLNLWRFANQVNTSQCPVWVKSGNLRKSKCTSVGALSLTAINMAVARPSVLTKPEMYSPLTGAALYDEGRNRDDST